MKTIKSKREFSLVFKTGEKLSFPLVRAISKEVSKGDQSKVAFVAPKRLGNAPQRNRCKRLLREAARACNLPYEGRHLILFATHKTKEASSREVEEDLKRLLKKL